MSEVDAKSLGEWCVSIDLDANHLQIDSRSVAGLRVDGDRTSVYFEGKLFNRGVDDLDDASYLKGKYEREGPHSFGMLRGRFAAVLHDKDRRIAFAIRDPVGTYPLFHTQSGTRWHFSPRIELLLSQPGVSRRVNRFALAAHLSHIWSEPTETYFDSVRRIPPGHLLTITEDVADSSRYWDPVPSGPSIRWLDDGSAEHFSRALDLAVERSLGERKTGIFLSGGFDSVSVAAVATDISKRRRQSAPLALSLGFPDPECNEEVVQRRVAASLGLPQIFLPFWDALDNQSLLRAGIELNARSVAPILNSWAPVYDALAARGRDAGCDAILTGAGGDEWLGVSPFLSADLLKRGDIAGLVRLYAITRRSFQSTPLSALRGILWTFGTRPQLSALAAWLVPSWWARRRATRMARACPPWVAPDPGLVAELEARAAKVLPEARPADGFYLREIRRSLDHPLVSLELEEHFESTRRTGVRFGHPYWDADLVERLCWTSPDRLNQGDRAKGLVRSTVTDRFPGLGFERQKKVTATTFHRSVLRREAAEALSSIGGIDTLVSLGVVSAPKFSEFVRQLLGGERPAELYRLRDVLALEAWARSHA